MIFLQGGRLAALLGTLHALGVHGAGSSLLGVLDFSGFDRENWRLRTGTEHKQLACNLSKTTKSQRYAAESASGCRYSVLSKLPYFNAPRMLIIDPMHNLFLGFAKHFLRSILIISEIYTITCRPCNSSSR